MKLQIQLHYLCPFRVPHVGYIAGISFASHVFESREWLAYNFTYAITDANHGQQQPKEKMGENAMEEQREFTEMSAQALAPSHSAHTDYKADFAHTSGYRPSHTTENSRPISTI